MYQDLKPKLVEDADVLQFEGHLYLLKKDFSNALTVYVLITIILLSGCNYVFVYLFNFYVLKF